MTQAFNRDCMEAMKEFPDNYFDLAVVDPPYGDANGKPGTGGGTTDSEDGGSLIWSRFGQRFDRYRTNRYMGGVESSPEQAEHGQKNTVKKSLRGTLPQGRSISKNCSASHAIRSSGAEITFPCRRHGAFSFGAS